MLHLYCICIKITRNSLGTGLPEKFTVIPELNIVCLLKSMATIYTKTREKK